MKSILGRKVGMTQVFATDGTMIPVTVVEVLPNVVLQKKTAEKDGYDALQIGYEEQRENITNKSLKGIFAKANTTAKKFVREIKGDELNSYEVGQNITADIFAAGETVDVVGTSKGKGFSGSIKRFGYSIGPKGHGSGYHRAVGSMATVGRTNNRVHPGKLMPGHDGNDQSTVLNLEVVSVDTTKNAVLIKGCIPGPNRGLVTIRSAVKAQKKTIDVLNQTGTKVEEVELNKNVFETKINDNVVFDAIQVYISNCRQATAKTKKRAEVSGGGRKPWRQKGTGRARQGSTRSPQWRHGGIVFGPTGNQNYEIKQNKKEARLALKSVLSEKAANNNLILVNEIKYEKPQTKAAVEMLSALKAKSKTLVVLSEDSANYEAILSMGNLPNVMVLFADEINVYDVVNSDSIVMTVDAMKSIEEVLA